MSLKLPILNPLQIWRILSSENRILKTENRFLSWDNYFEVNGNWLDISFYNLYYEINDNNIVHRNSFSINNILICNLKDSWSFKVCYLQSLFVVNLFTLAFLFTHTLKRYFYNIKTPKSIK